MPTWRGLLATLAPLDPARVGGRRRAARRPDGQLRGRAPEPRRRPAGPPGPAADRRRDRGRLVRHAAGARSTRAAARRRPDGRLHVISLIGPGGVHANDRHLVALVELARRAGRPGRPRPRAARRPRHAAARRPSASSRDLERRLAAAHPDARIASVGGRYYAMDRDQRWDRVERGYDAIVHGVGERARERDRRDRGRLRARRERRVRRCRRSSTASTASSATGDPIIHANFRADRARQLTHALADPVFDGFDRTAPDGRPAPTGLLVVTMTEYEAGLPVEVAFPPEQARSLARGVLGGRLAPVPRRRDREVRARHVLLQRRRRGALAGRGPPADPEPEGRDLRPRARR